MSVAINWEAISAVANSVMAIASVFGLGFIYKQLVTLSKQECQQNIELKLSHYSEYTKRYQDILLHLPSSVGAPDFSIEKLQPNVKENILIYMRAYFDLCYEEWDLHRRKLIEESSWEVWKSGMSKTLRRPAFRTAWNYFTEVDSEYGKEFTIFVTEIQS